jgi:peptidoglycan hydrolase-like protein with peptidoglycan-binding domain
MGMCAIANTIFLSSAKGIKKMENLAYIHLAEAYEQQNIPQTPSRKLKWPNFSARAISSAISVLLTASVFGTTVPAIAAMKVGDSGEQVVEVQRRLQELGYFKFKATGYYGSLTEDAVKHFQQNNGLVADGVIGSNTKSALSQVYPETPAPKTQPVVRLGNQSPTVLRVQRQLSSLKLYDWQKMDGKFDEATKQAVMNFQKANGLTPDGIVGLNTHKMLREKTGL